MCRTALRKRRAQHGLDLLRGTDRRGGLADDHGVAVPVLADAAGHGHHMPQVDIALRIGRRVDHDEQRVAMQARRALVGREAQPPCRKAL
ncbi:hypothetical protein D9M69_539110 [compost metagenome]